MYSPYPQFSENVGSVGSKSGSTNITVVGLVVGLLVAVAVVAGLVFVLIMQHRKKRQSEPGNYFVCITVEDI